MKGFLTAFMLLLSSISYAQSDRLTVKINGLKNKEGQVILDIFDTKDGYPMETDKAILRKTMAIPANGSVVFYVDDLPQGEYAFALIHDQNSNNKLDVNFLGIPKEGAGASNNAKGFMSPPSYKEAQFNFNQSTEMTIKMLYF